MAKKWKATTNDQFLGYYYGSKPETAAKKAVAANMDYHGYLIGTYGVVLENGQKQVHFRLDEVQ